MEEEKLTPEKAESLIRYFSKYGVFKGNIIKRL
jgi:hypothetical protein